MPAQVTRAELSTGLIFCDLTDAEREATTNQCGSEGFTMPHFGTFLRACKAHDFRYWLGCTENDRGAADDTFYFDMLEGVRRKKWWQRWFLYGVAWTYYRAVQLGGRRKFHYGRFRTRANLDALTRDRSGPSSSQA